MVEEPQVRIAVPRLPCRADRLQRGHVRRRLALGKQCAHECRRHAEHRHALRLDQLPQPVGRKVRRAFRVDDGRAAGAAADHCPRAHDPTHVGGEMDAVARLDVGLVGDLARDRRQEAGLHVQRALRLARRPGRVRKQVRMFRIDLSRGQTPIRRRVCDEVIPKAIATEGHREVVEPEPPPDDGVRHGRRALQRLVGDLLHRQDLAAAERTVGRDQRLRLGIRKTRRDRRRGEAGEDRHLHGSEVRARVRRDRDLRRHRQVDPNRVALADPDRREPLGQPVDGVRQLAPR